MKIKGSKRVSKKLEGYVLAIKASNPDFSANQVWRHLRREANGNSVIPKLRTIQKILAKGKPQIDKITESGLDFPWHLGLMSESKYDISPEAIRCILDVQIYIDNVPERASKPLSIREAQWISRLHTLFPKDDPQAAFKMLRWVEVYADFEIVAELSGTIEDTRVLDRGLRNGETPFEKYQSISWFQDSNSISWFQRTRGKAKDGKT